MHNELSTTSEFRAAVVRMVAAAEYFKSAGELPPWAQADLDAWYDRPATPVEVGGTLRTAGCR